MLEMGEWVCVLKHNAGGAGELQERLEEKLETRLEERNEVGYGLRQRSMVSTAGAGWHVRAVWLAAVCRRKPERLVSLRVR